MTAEQALIEENKKDLNVRYLTRHFFKHTFVNTFWETKPVFDKDESRWIGGKRIAMNDFDYTFNFNDGQLCILCIDDIKPEVAPIPENWYIEFNENNFMILDSWRQKKAHSFLRDSFLENCFLLSDDFFKDGSFYVAVGQSIPENYQKITLEQFKKYVLGEEKEEEKQEENSSSHSTGSYVKSGSIGSVGFSGQYVKAGRIVSVDINDNPFPSPKTNSTFEFYSTRCWIEDRINYINQFVKRNMDSDLCIPTEWVEERNELIEKLKNL